MRRARLALTVVAALLGGCVMYEVPAPRSWDSAGVVLEIEAYAPLTIVDLNPDVVYFAQLEDGRLRPPVRRSSFVAHDVAYLLNVPPGEYAVVALSCPSPDASSVSDASAARPVTRMEIVLPTELSQATGVSVRAGELALVGRLVVDTSVDTGDTDEARRLLALAQPGTTNALGPGSASYRAVERELRRDEATRNALRVRAAKDLAAAGWGEILNAP